VRPHNVVLLNGNFEYVPIISNEVQFWIAAPKQTTRHRKLIHVHKILSPLRKGITFNDEWAVTQREGLNISSHSPLQPILGPLLFDWFTDKTIKKRTKSFVEYRDMMAAAMVWHILYI
jgi:hypothetical protein